MNFLVAEWIRGVRFDQIVFLTGERKLLPSEQCEGCKSERDMMLLTWETTVMPESLRSIPLTIIDSPPAEDYHYATIESTALAWLQTNSPSGSYLIFSSQPYVGYQDAILKTRAPLSLTIETIGSAGGESLPNIGPDGQSIQMAFLELAYDFWAASST